MFCSRAHTLLRVLGPSSLAVVDVGQPEQMLGSEADVLPAALK